ncbi:MAG: hypothetical protein QOJ64_1619 [Acidobacteriota bacterium]|jgi:hypothetical protein|nr:hypothetical protein [Acidobacteriota bacterium]
MALNRAVNISHGRGLPGTPLRGHRLSAAAKACMHRLLGKIRITEQADQRCQDSSLIHAMGVEHFTYLLIYLLGGTLGHDGDLVNGKWEIVNIRAPVPRFS